MAPRRLSDRDKDQIVQLYQQKGMTLAMLAEQFGVSASTVGRVVRQGPPAADAVQEELLSPGPGPETPKPSGKGRPVRKVKVSPEVSLESPETVIADSGSELDLGSGSSQSQSPSPGVARPVAEGRSESSESGATSKRTRRRSRTRTDGEPVGMDQRDSMDLIDSTDGDMDGGDRAIAASEAETPVSDGPRTKPQRRSRSRSPKAPEDTLPPEPAESSKPMAKVSPKTIIRAASKATPAPAAPTPAAPEPVTGDRRERAMVDDLDDDPYGDDLGDDSDLDLLEDGDDFDDDEDDEDGDLGHGLGIVARANATEPIEIYPLTAASIPNPCYLVVDRAANLVVRPLKDFQELGAIPDGEGNCNTLPVFDNHRVARRFSGRTQRVIKVPDSSIFVKATPHLQEKEITRLLIDGQVYAL
jgi:transposase-like protein